MSGRRIAAVGLIPAVAIGGCVGRCAPGAELGPCPAGEVVVVDDAPTGCDLVAGVNTLTILWPGADGVDEAWARQQADDAGCRFVVRWDRGVGTAAGEGCDF